MLGLKSKFEFGFKVLFKRCSIFYAEFQTEKIPRCSYKLTEKNCRYFVRHDVNTPVGIELNIAIRNGASTLHVTIISKTLG